MIKRISGILSAIILVTFGMSARDSIQVLDKTYCVDTLFHAKVGPGTTQTSLKLSGPNDLRVFYTTTDLRTPSLSMHVVSGNDMVAGCETTSHMAKRKSEESGLNVFVGCNGDFFSTKGVASNGRSVVGSSTSATVADGEIFRTSAHRDQFVIDSKGLPFAGRLSFSNSTLEIGSKKVACKGVNVTAYNNTITIYTPRYYGVTDQSKYDGNCTSVTAKLVEGEKFVLGKKCRFQITGEVTSKGAVDIPENSFVFIGRGDVMETMKTMQVGDIVTYEGKTEVAGEAVDTRQVVSGNPKILGGGEVLDTESERGDASSRHPRTGIGYGANKTKLIMMVVDGRSAISVGVRTSELAEIMRYAGATDGVNLDGGGSATLYTEAFGVRNTPSDGKERAVGNGFFVATSTPEDSMLAEIRCREWALNCPRNVIFKPVVYGYNQYGVLINKNIKEFELSCSETLGRIENGTTFVASGSGSGALTVTYKGISTKLPIKIVETSDVAMRMDSILIDTKREYPVEVQSMINEDIYPLAPSALSWTTDDATIAEIGAETGILKGVKNGTTTIHGTLKDYTGDVKVVVEEPTGQVMPIDLNNDVSLWKIVASGAKNIQISALENGFDMKYTGSSSRAPYIKMTRELTIYSLPDALRFRLNPGEADIKSIMLSVTTANGITQNVEMAKDVMTNTMSLIDFDLNEMCDTRDISVYPIKINSVYLKLAKIKSNQEYDIQFPGFEAIYRSYPSGVETVVDEETDFSIVPNPVEPGEAFTMNVNAEGKVTVLVFDNSGRVMKNTEIEVDNGKIQMSTDGLSSGIYFVRINGKAAKLIVR